MSEARTKSMIGGMTVLGIAGILCKLIGVLFTIPLTHLIGADGIRELRIGNCPRLTDC